MDITGTNDDDTLNGTALTDVIKGLGGDDTIYSNGGADRLYGGAGDDMIYIRLSKSHSYGQSGNDTFVATELSYTGKTTSIDGGDGIDTFDGSGLLDPDNKTAHQFYYSFATDLISIGDYNMKSVEVLRGPNFATMDYFFFDLATAITVYGGSGADNVQSSMLAALTFHGGAGDDHVWARASGTQIFGDEGNELIELDAAAGEHDIRIDGGIGLDTISFSGSNVDLALGYVVGTNGVRYDVVNVEGISVFNVQSGSAISGDGANNSISVFTSTRDASTTINGRGGDDTIFGSVAADKLHGGLGNDVLNGGAGKDTLTGEGGADQFLFRSSYESTAARSTADTITDFRKAEGDRIALSFDADTNVDGVQHFTFIGHAAFSGTAGEVRFDNVGAATFVSADTNGDGVVDFSIKLAGTIALAATDFVL